ncbi:hypothetical protein BVX95_02175 [archaeon D22]|nr:hypothetical protein BVX95_02175 [archaeon D22]
MKIRKAVKKIVALTAGVTMLGATIMGAAAADLASYPEPFVKDGQANAVVVVGEQAATADVVGAIDIAASLQAAAVSETSVSVSGTGVTVTGGKDKEIALGDTLGASFGTLDDNDVSVLKDEKISWNEEDLDVDETVTVSGVKVLTSADDKDFGAEIFLGTNTATGAIEYKYTIDDKDLNTSLVDEDEPLKVDILGRTLEIEKVSSNQITVTTANEYFLNVGDSVTVDGKKVTLVKVGSGATEAVVVDVNGEVKSISGSSSEKVNGIRVQIESTFADDDSSLSSATLKIGDKITDEIKNGDHMELFGEPDSNDAEWDWIIDGSSSNKLVIGATHSLNLNSDTKDVRAIGEPIELPDAYAKVEIASLTAEADKEVTVSFEDGLTVDKDAAGDDIESIDGKPALKFEAANEEDLFEIDANGNPETSEIVYLIANSTSEVVGAFENGDGDIQLFDAGGLFVIANDEMKINVTFNETDDQAAVAMTGFNSLDASSGTISLIANITQQFFGAKEGEEEAGEVSGTVGVVGTTDEDFRTTFGTVIYNVEDGLQSDEFKFAIPSEQVKANVVIVGSEGTVAGGEAGSVTTQSVNAIAVGLGMLDSEFTVGSQNAIVVGGPCANTAAAELLGNPANCVEGFEAGKAMIKLFETDGTTSMLVAGFSAQDTQGATRVVSQYDMYDLSGSEATVVVTSLSDINLE